MSSTRFNPPVPTFEEVNPTTGDTSAENDGTIVVGENDYESSTNKATLRSYISTLTRGRTPTVIPPGPAGRPTSRGIIEYNGPTPDHGNAYPLGDGSGVADSTFTELGVEGGSNNALQDYSNSGLFDNSDGTTLDGIVNKGRSGHANGRETLSGHLLLQGVIGQTTTNAIPRGRTEGAAAYLNAMPEILSNSNINDPSSKTAASESMDFSSRVRIQRGDEMLSSGPTGENGRVSVGQLSRVALDIMLGATGKRINPDDLLPNAPGLRPSQVQEGLKRVDVADLAVGSSPRISGLSSTVDGTGPVDLPTSDGVGEDRYSVKSYGVTYNPLESFTAIDASAGSFGVIAATATAAVFATGATLAAFKKVPKSRPTYTKLSTRKSDKLELGAFNFDPGGQGSLAEFLASAGIETDLSNLLNIYGVTNGQADYGQCVIVGFASLMGVKFEYDTLFTEGSVTVGDNEVKIRKISSLAFFTLAGLVAVRILAVAVTGEKGYYMNLFREIIKDTGALISNISSDPRSLLSGGISDIINAKLIRFVDTLARIGDVVVLGALAVDRYQFNKEQDDPYRDGFIPTEVAVWSDPASVTNGITSMQKFAQSRIRGARFGSKRGSSLGVGEIPSAHLVPKTYNFGNAKLSKYGEKASKNARGLRLDQKQVADLERILDAEYMPFYFQDLRTNEIVAFHAFLDELSDSYTANYNNTGGYGRIEEVKTYKDTKRSVGCTFHVIATNEEDFEYMWWQINKLTTLVYPQWSQGRTVKVPVDAGAGPIDYDITQPFSQIPTATPVIRVRVGDLIRSNYSRFNLKRLFGFMDEEKRQSAPSTPPVSGYTVSAGIYNFAQLGLDGQYTHYTGGEQYDVAEPGELVGPAAVNIVYYQGEKTNLRAVRVATGATIMVPANELIEKPTPLASETSPSSVFYKAEGDEANTIIKSFESTMGMGLASVVTQLQFTWMDNSILWGAGEDGPGHRAPRSCKVQMSFDPIHDIAPGLDHQGLNRAPIYPVGRLVNNLVEGGEPSPYGVGSVSYAGSFLKKANT